ncbi:MAG: transposase [bacterium]|nr:transposase [bacterium]
MSRRRYDEEFKRNAVELLLGGGHDLKPLARELGVCPTTLREWREFVLDLLRTRCRMPSFDCVHYIGREKTRRSSMAGGFHTLGRFIENAVVPSWVSARTRSPWWARTISRARLRPRPAPLTRRPRDLSPR